MRSKYFDQSSGDCPAAGVGGGPPGVVDKDVDRSERSFYGIELLTDQGKVADIPNERNGLAACAADCLCSRRGAFLVDVGDNDGNAFGRERPGDRAAKPTTGAEYERRLAVQLKIQLFLLLFDGTMPRRKRKKHLPFYPFRR